MDFLKYSYVSSTVRGAFFTTLWRWRNWRENMPSLTDSKWCKLDLIHFPWRLKLVLFALILLHIPLNMRQKVECENKRDEITNDRERQNLKNVKEEEWVCCSRSQLEWRASWSGLKESMCCLWAGPCRPYFFLSNYYYFGLNYVTSCSWHWTFFLWVCFHHAVASKRKRVNLIIFNPCPAKIKHSCWNQLNCWF